MAEQTLTERIEVEGIAKINRDQFESYWISSNSNSMMITGTNLHTEIKRAGYNPGDKIKYRIVIEPVRDYKI